MVEYINSKGHTKVISDTVVKKKAVADILDFCKKNHYDVSYMRINDYPTYWEIDVGSHTEFFKIYKEPGNEEV